MNTEQEMKIKKESFTLPYTLILVLLLILMQNVEAIDLYSGDYTIPDYENHPELIGLHELNTYNDVTVTLLGLGGPSTFNMFNNSKFTMYDGSISELNLYNTAAATLFGADDIQRIFVNPASTGIVKLYAVELFHQIYPFDPENQYIDIYWLNDPEQFPRTISLVGTSTYSHIQFIPEPATLAFIALGCLALRKFR